MCVSICVQRYVRTDISVTIIEWKSKKSAQDWRLCVKILDTKRNATQDTSLQRSRERRYISTVRRRSVKDGGFRSEDAQSVSRSEIQVERKPVKELTCLGECILVSCKTNTLYGKKIVTLRIGYWK